MSKIIEVVTKGGVTEDDSFICLHLEDLLNDKNAPQYGLYSFLHNFFLEEESGAQIVIHSVNAIATTTYTLI